MTRKSFVVFVCMLSGLCLPASAGEGYVGASYLDSNAEFRTVSQNYDISSSGWKLFGGFNFIKYFGAELTYYDVGSFDDQQGANSIDSDIEVFDLAGRGILPLGQRVELFARLGYSRVSVDTTSTTGPLTASTSAEDWELLYGVGVGLKLGRRFGIRVEYEAWDVEDSLDTLSIGAFFRFGGN